MSKDVKKAFTRTMNLGLFSFSLNEQKSNKKIKNLKVYHFVDKASELSFFFLNDKNTYCKKTYRTPHVNITSKMLLVDTVFVNHTKSRYLLHMIKHNHSIIEAQMYVCEVSVVGWSI